MIGITPTGFVRETTDELRTGMIRELLPMWGNAVDVSDEDPIGQLIGVVADRLGSLHDLYEQFYSCLDPDAATGDALTNLLTLFGVLPTEPFGSTVVLTLTGDNGTVILAGQQAETESGVVFETLEEVTLATALPRPVSLTVPVGAFRSNAGNMYVVTVSGVTSAGAGPSGTGSAIADGGATWRFVGEGLAYAQARAETIEPGAFQALSGSVNIIKTPTGGWESVINLLDADLGLLEETTESYRLRWQDSLAGAGGHTVDAIRADLLRLTGVKSARILQNVTDVTNGDGMPPHTMEALIRGGDDIAIATMLLETGIGVGYSTFGNRSVVVKDDLGNDYTIRFSRPETKDIYVDMTVAIPFGKTAQQKTDLENQIKLNIVTWGDAQDTGKDAVAMAIAAQAFKSPDVLDVPVIKISDAPTPTLPTTIPIALRELALYDTSRINITFVEQTP